MRYFLFAISVVFCGAVGWHLYQESLASVETESKQKKEAVFAVEVVRAVRRPITERIELVGSLEPIAEVAIRSRLSGYLKQLPFDVGDEVSAEQTVVELDDAATQELVSRAAAAEQVAQAQLTAQLARQEQALREVERLQALAKSGVSTAQEIEEAQSTLSVARAETELERARLAQAESDLERNRLILDELKIATPISGFVAERNVDIGDLARAEDVLMKVVDLSSIRTVVNVVERDYEKIRLGQTATVTVDAVADREFAGSIVRKAPVLDPTTRTARVMIEIANAETLLKPGMHGRVMIVSEDRARALVVPSSAVQERDGQTYVYTLDESGSTAVQRDVSIGIRDGDSVEILTGVSEDDSIITLGGRLIHDGAPVEPFEVSMTNDADVLAAQPETSGLGAGD